MTFSTIQLFTPAGLQTIASNNQDIYIQSPLDETFKLDWSEGIYSKEIDVVASFKQNRYMRFYHQQKNRYILEELDLSFDEIVSIGRLFYVNPLIEWNEKIMYVGIQHKNGTWMKLSFPFSDLLNNQVDELIEVEDYPTLSFFEHTCASFILTEQDKRLALKLALDYDMEEEKSISENEEYEGLLFSQSEDDIDVFIMEKRLAQNERRSSLYTHFIENMEQEFLVMQKSLSSEENKQHLANVLKLLKQ